MYENVIIPSNI